MRHAEAIGRETYETGAEPDFKIDNIARYEDAGDGMIRLYICSHRGAMDRVEYSAHCSPETLMRMARTCETIAAEFMEVRRFRKALSEH